MKKQTTRGFTLIELMAVVTIMGILAAVAIPAYAKYTTKTKTAEAMLNLKGIHTSAVAYLSTVHSNGQSGYLPANTKLTPKKVARGTKNKVNDAGIKEFTDNSSWAALGFTPQDDFYYSYRFINRCNGNLCKDGKKVIIRAKGDLNGDRTKSTYELISWVKNGTLVSRRFVVEDANE